MKTFFRCVLVLLILAVAAPGFAMIHIERVTKERAKALGMEIRYNASGDSVVRVELEFKAQGELKDYSRVDLEFMGDGKWVLTSSLKEESSKPGVILVSFAVDRASLDRITLRVVSRSTTRTMIGYDIRVKDFVEVKKVR